MKPRQLPPFEPKIILCIAAHPDDLEFGASGSVAAWTAAGVKVHYLICTDGSKGSDDENVTGAELTKIRRSEQHDAAKILGLSSVTFFDYPDGETEPSSALKQDISREIRRIKPDTVVTQDPKMLYDANFGMVNHTDHRSVAIAAMDAVYPLARDRLSFPGLDQAGFKPHKVKELLFMSFEESNYFVDISATFEIKLRALAAHASQVDITAVEPWLRDMGSAFGSRNGYAYAEGFTRLSLFI